MIRSMIFSTNGLETNAKAIDVISNNLANASSAGFKKSIVFSQTLKNVKEAPNGEGLANEVIDFSQGAIRETGNPLTLAIQGDGFFKVENEKGTYYTRQGNFTLDTDGYLVTQDGDFVLGDSGPILLDEQFSIQDDGAVIMDDDIVDYITVTKFIDPTQLIKVGNGYFKADNNTKVDYADEEVKIKSGFLEDSNVNTLEEMVNMIEIYRQFEANQKALRTQDETLEKAVNDVGKA